VRLGYEGTRPGGWQRRTSIRAVGVGGDTPNNDVMMQRTQFEIPIVRREINQLKVTSRRSQIGRFVIMHYAEVFPLRQRHSYACDMRDAQRNDASIPVP